MNVEKERKKKSCQNLLTYKHIS